MRFREIDMVAFSSRVLVLLPCVMEVGQSQHMGLDVATPVYQVCLASLAREASRLCREAQLEFQRRRSRDG